MEKPERLSIADKNQKIVDQHATITELRRNLEHEFRRGQHNVLIRLGFLLHDIPMNQVDWKKVEQKLDTGWDGDNLTIEPKIQV